MKNKKVKKIFRSPWFIGITATAIGSVLAESFSKFKILTAILKLFINIKNLIFKFFSASISIPLWLFILILLVSVVFIARILISSWGAKKNTSIFLNYIEDELFGIVWKWRWDYDRFSRKYDIEDLLPFCPKCDCQLTRTYDEEGFQCPNNDFRKVTFPKSYGEIRLIIKQRVRQRIRKNIYQNQN